MAAEMINSFILKADRIEHPGWCFSHAGVFVPVAVRSGDGFYKDPAKQAEIIEFLKFLAIPEAAGSGCHGVFELYTGDIYIQVCHCLSSFRLSLAILHRCYGVAALHLMQLVQIASLQ